MDLQNGQNLIASEEVASLEHFAQQLAKCEQAILAAQANQSLAAEALAQKQTAELFLARGKEKVAAIYMQDAYDCYAKLGAFSKTKNLEHNYPHLLLPTLSRESSYFTEDFIATISHEFRNPLNGILGMSETLLEEVFGVMNEQQLNAVSTIDRSGWYLLALINNMVDLSKVQVGKLELEISTGSVLEICTSTISFVKHHAIQKLIQLETEIADNVGYISVDLQRMRQVLINLINHAIDSTPVGGGVRFVVSRMQPDPADPTTATIQFSVIDTSKEIPLAVEKPAVTATPVVNSQRIALGLMLVNPIVELHGGSLNYQSAIGRGSCVTISLPHSCLISEATVEQIASTGDLGALSGMLMQNTHDQPLILIVEDNEMNINTISSYLMAKNYRPIVAQDGAAAIEMTQQYHPDLILMDIQMPGMDGLEAITRIRQYSDLKSIPIIALTALALEGDRERCLAAGANEYITKPVKLKQLKSAIRQLLTDKSEVIAQSSDPWN
jgi:signal transduction histidine kinase/ActR/RegA family two-component response regulator